MSVLRTMRSLRLGQHQAPSAFLVRNAVVRYAVHSKEAALEDSEEGNEDKRLLGREQVTVPALRQVATVARQKKEHSVAQSTGTAMASTTSVSAPSLLILGL